MRKVNLTMKENDKYLVIKNLVESNGNKQRAAKTIGCTIRHVNRLITKYKNEGKGGFVHKNRNRKSSRALSQEYKDNVINLFKTKYYDANFSHALSLMKNNDNINISYYAFYTILKEHGILSLKCRKATRKAKAKLLLEKQKNKEKLTPVEKDLIVNTNILDLEDSHPRQSRKKWFGELLQMDASEFLWFGDKKTTLHGAIDDATGKIYLYFDYQETLNGYYNLLNNVLITDGIPFELLTDNRTVFYYNAKKDVDLAKDTFTQFGYACKKLGITLSTTSIPQKKGRIERLWETLQSRLPVELRIANITTLDEANKFLVNFTSQFNKEFSLQKNYTINCFEKQIEKEFINYTLAVLSPRKFDSGSSIKFQNKYYQAFDKTGKLIPFKNKTKALVIKAFNGELLVTVDEQIYQLQEVLSHKETSEEFDVEVKETSIEKPKPYIPPMEHVWKRESYLHYVNSQTHHKNCAYN